MANKTLNTFDNLPGWAKGAIAVAVVGALGFIGYKIYKAVKKADEAKDSKKLANEAANELAQLEKQGQKISFAPSAYTSAINTIVKLLDGCETAGSELQAIEEVIKVVKTPIDWSYIQKQFGTKDISDCMFGKTNYDLSSLLKDQLDTGGAYAIDKDGYKDSGFAINSRNILEKYFRSKGIKW